MTTTLKNLFKKFELEKVHLNVGFIGIEMSFEDSDRDAAWELYIEMLTRIVTQPLPKEVGDEKTALESVYSLFPTTREILRKRGRKTLQFSKIAIPILNQVVRPFTAKWHNEVLQNGFDDSTKKEMFRTELQELQKDLYNYNRMLAEIAGVEDLTNLESADNHDCQT